MAGSPQFKVYYQKVYIGATKTPHDAAILVAAYGEGATIRWQHSIVVWQEGKEYQSAAESYDYVAITVYQRINEHNQKMYARYAR